MKSQTRLNVIFTCGREPEYPRNHFLIHTLEKYHHVQQFTNRSRWLPARLARVTLQYPGLLWKKHDLSIVGFIGQPLVPLIRIFSRKPILFDPFISLYDTLIFDRKRAAPGSLAARIAYFLDSASCAQSDSILVDTQAHARYFNETFHIPMEKIHVLLVGCDESLFFPRENVPKTEPPLVLYYSSFLPLHGTETVIRAARLLQDREPAIRFRIIGKGMESERISCLAKDLDLRNVAFYPPMPLNTLPDQIANATVCLGGHFSDNDKARRVIAGKTYQCLAMGKATIVGENPANHELLTDRKDALFCEMANPEALAESIVELVRSPSLRAQLGQGARATFLKHASYAVLEQQLEEIIQHMLAAQ